MRMKGSIFRYSETYILLVTYTVALLCCVESRTLNAVAGAALGSDLTARGHVPIFLSYAETSREQAFSSLKSSSKLGEGEQRKGDPADDV